MTQEEKEPGGKDIRFYMFITDDTLHGIASEINQYDIEYDELLIHGTPFKGEHNEWCLLISYR